MLASAQVLHGCVSALCTVERLYGNEGLLQLILGDSDAEVEPGTELRELVVHEDYDEVVSCYHHHHHHHHHHPVNTLSGDEEHHGSCRPQLHSIIIIFALPAQAAKCYINC